jgi:hypothetical protein
MRKRRKRNGSVSAPCPKCKANSHVIVTIRVEGVVVRARQCFGRKAHTFRTKEIPVQS